MESYHQLKYDCDDCSVNAIYLSTNTHEVMKTGTLLLVITSYFYFLALFQLNKTTDITFHFTLIALAFIEVIWGYCQLYAYLPSQNSRFGLTGSFDNPGPYAAFSGYYHAVQPVLDNSINPKIESHRSTKRQKRKDGGGQ